MKSYNNDPAFKKKAVEAAIRHRDMDMLMSGTYGVRISNDFKGCSIGCDAFDITGGIAYDPHQATADYFGFPLWFERLRDEIFEGLDQAGRVNWHVDIKQAVPIGMDESDFDQVKKDFLVWLMEENIKVVERLDIVKELKDQILSAINGVINAFKTGEGMEAARDSAIYALDAARDARDASAARAARDARDAARDAIDANYAGHKKQANKLIELFKRYNAIKS